jgi:hypothetical protein
MKYYKARKREQISLKTKLHQSRARTTQMTASPNSKTSTQSKDPVLQSASIRTQQITSACEWTLLTQRNLIILNSGMAMSLALTPDPPQPEHKPALIISKDFKM